MTEQQLEVAPIKEDTTPDKPPIDIDKIIKEFDNEAESAQVQSIPDLKNAVSVTAEMLVGVLASVTEYLAHVVDVPEIAFTEQDKISFTQALKPFEPQLVKLMQFAPYIPLAVFSVGYTIRVLAGFKNKKERDQIENTKPKAQKEEKEDESKTDDKPEDSGSPTGA